MLISTILSLAVCVPALFLKNFKELAGLSTLGLFCAFLICGGSVGLVVWDPQRAHVPQGQGDTGYTLFNARGSLVALGIYSLSASSHSAIPPIRASLKDPAKFTSVLTWMFSLIMLSYMLLSAAAYFYFGNSVAQVLTNSFDVSALADVYLFHPALNYSNFLALCLGVKALVMLLVETMA